MVFDMNANTKLKEYSLKDMEYYKIHGRTDESQYPLPLFFNGSGIEVNATGTELWIDIDVDYENFEPWAACFVNGELMSRQMLAPGSYSLCLFRNMNPDSVKNIRFVRELQAMSEDDLCHILIRGFRSDGFFLPVADKRFKLEFIGDSITSGEGTYGAHNEEDWIPMFMSCSHSYSLMISKALDADYRLISQGGWGVLCGWDNNPHHNIPSVYEKICGLALGDMNAQLGAAKPYDFDTWEPDAIIVNLGTNDASAFVQPQWSDPATGETFKQRLNSDGSYNQEDLLRFEQAVIDFLSMIRRNNPDSPIVWVYGMLGYELTLAITDAINTYRKLSGDSKVSFLQLPATTDETVGSRCHPGVPSHQRSAQVIIEYLQQLLN